MEIYTVQIAKSKKVPSHIRVIDATVKSGDRRLSPTWDMVMGVKDYLKAYRAGEDTSPYPITVAEFKKEYKRLMQVSLELNRDFWVSLVNEESIAVACYCSLDMPHPFCHRLLLKHYLVGLCKQLDIPVSDKGEFHVNGVGKTVSDQTSGDANTTTS